MKLSVAPKSISFDRNLLLSYRTQYCVLLKPDMYYHSTVYCGTTPRDTMLWYRIVQEVRMHAQDTVGMLLGHCFISWSRFQISGGGVCQQKNANKNKILIPNEQDEDYETDQNIMRNTKNLCKHDLM